MQFQSNVLQQIVNSYLDKEYEEEIEECHEFMELLLDDDNNGILDDDEIDTEARKKIRWKHLRLEWSYHVSQLLHEGYFKDEYRMSYETWMKLYVVLSPKLRRKKNVRTRNNPVTVQLIMGLGLRWLTGTDMNSCRHIFKMSQTEAYRCASKFMYAVLTTKSLQIRLPKSRNQWTKVKDGFRNKSTRGVMYGCCGAIDGIFIRTMRPRYSDVKNVRAYYSGHYEHYGINCQGMCDAHLRFLYFGVVAPGSTNDNIAYMKASDLREEIEKLEIGEFVVGDAAYTVTEHLLIPFTGSQRDVEEQDAFNFYLSQLRIRIEMAFGLLVKKFSILQTILKHRIGTVSRIIMCCAQLHNFVINNDGSDIEDNMGDGTIDVNNLQPLNGERLNAQRYSPGGNMVYQPTMIENGFNEIVGTSNTRDEFVQFLKNNGFKRPAYNLLRNSRLRQLTREDIEGNRRRYKDVETSTEFYHPM